VKITKSRLKEIIRDELKKITESLPVTAKAIKSTKRMKPPSGKKDKEAYLHHKIHSGPHITGQGAEHATYDFDDSNYDVEGGLQDREDTQDRGYEPVEKIGKKSQKKEVKEFINKLDENNYTKLLKQELIKELSSTTITGRGLDHGDSWPDGIYTRYGERKIMGPAAMPRGMKQIVAPASDSIYGGDGSLREEPTFVTRTKITPEYINSGHVLDPHKHIRSDEPPLHPKMRIFGRRAFGQSSEYIIPEESANFSHTTKNILVKPTTPPEGSIRTGGSAEGQIEPTPEPGSKELGSKTGYRQVQKGGKSVTHDLDPLYILKMMGKYDPKREKM